MITAYNKYRNKKTLGYDSKKESKRASDLKLLENIGKLSDLKEQVVFELQPSFRVNGKSERAIKYIADFTYTIDGILYAEDTKGFKTDIYKVKRKMFLYNFKDIVFIES